MRKMFLFVLAAAAFLAIVPAQNAQAQSRSRSETPKVEIGGHYTLLRFSDAETTDPGVGGRLTYNVTNSFGIEGEFNFFPQERLNFANLSSPDSQRMQGLFGAKYGIRSQKFGVFGKVRPGFIRFGEGTAGVSATEFALDIGGVVELYPTRPVSLRFDVGNTLIRFGALSGGYTSNNLQVSTGVAFRF